MTGTAGREVTLQLGAESYVLKANFAAICGIEERIGTNLFDIGRRIEVAQISAMELIDFAHACIAEAGYEVTREHLAELIVESGAGAAVRPLNEYCQVYVFGAGIESDTDDGETATPATPGMHPDAA